MAFGEIPVPVSGLGFEQKRNASEFVSTPRIEKAKQVLHLAVQEQLIAVSTGRFQNFSGDITNKERFDAFINDPLFLETYSVAQLEAQRMSDDEEYFRCLKGAMFQQLAYLSLSALDNAIILPEESVFEIIRTLNPNNQITKFPFSGRGIEHRYIPDGLQIDIDGDKPKIVKVLEYSLVQYKPRMARQLDGFGHLVRELGELAYSSLDLMHICPEPGEKGMILEIPGVKKQLMPFTYDEFVNEFLHDQIYFGKVDGEKTLAQIRDEYFPL
jgi:hypothetical protein